MITTPQYGNFFSLYISLLAALPCVIMALCGRKSKIVNILVSIIMITCIIGWKHFQFLEFLLFLIGELVLIFFYNWFCRKHCSRAVFCLVFLFSLAPLLLVRFSYQLPINAELIGFVGISYMCFKVWQLLIEIHDRKITSLSLIDVLSFLLFFPSFSSGPIARYQNFLDEQKKSVEQHEYIFCYFVPGVEKIFQGLFYKFVLSHFINSCIMSHIPDVANFVNVILYMYSYTAYLFFDFGGYSLIAIGMGMLMGIRLPDNFNKPFLARNMKEFWERWHISLSTWFNDYVFGRFVLSNIRSKRIESPKVAARLGYLVTMLTMGLWHGFSLQYVLYGLYQGSLLVLTDLYIRSKIYRKWKKSRFFTPVSRIVCFQFISFGMLLFSGYFWFI